MLCFPMLISSLPGANPLPPEHKIGIFVLGRAFVFWEWWVLSCILTFVVCLSNFYELFLLKLLLRVCWSVLSGALLP